MSQDDPKSVQQPGSWYSSAVRDFVRRELDGFVAPPMWVATLVWMVSLAGALQVLRAHAESQWQDWMSWCLIAVEFGLAVPWLLIILESVAHYVAKSPHRKYNLLYCFVPPLRLGARDHETWTEVWLPGLGFVKVDRHLRQRVEKAISPAMVGFALLVLPLLGIELGWSKLVRQHWGLDFALDTASSIIWLAFALELTVMVSIARRKMKYLAKHWIDLVIVLLPMVEVMPALRLLTLGRLSYVARLSRAYRTRGMAMRAFRALLLLDSVQRLLHLNPEKRLATLREHLEDHYHEIERIRTEMRKLEMRIDEEQRDEEEESG